MSDETVAVVQGQDTTLANGHVTVQLPGQVKLSAIRLKVKPAGQQITGDRRLVFVFDISARDAANQPATQFSQPLTITLHVADLFGSFDEPVFVAYLNEQTATWEELNTVKVDTGNGEIVFTTNHFSTYGAGVTVDFSQQTSPAAWTLKFNDAQISSFDGGLNWSYDFGLPNGPGGVRPYLGLNYNSRRVDGILDYPPPNETVPGPTDPSPELGYGWELDAGEISWTGIGAHYSGNHYADRIAWRPSWMLRLNGQSIRVDPSESLIYQINGIWNEYKMWQYKPWAYCGKADGSYRAEDRHDIRIRWLCGDEDGYWEVALPDGTVYLYGTAADSRQRANAVMSEYGDVNNYQPEPRTIRWRLKEIRFTNGVSAVYTYTTDTTVPNCCLAVTPYEYQTYVSEVAYPGTRVALNWTSGKAPLQNMELYRLQGDGASWSRTKRWSFTYTNMSSPGDSYTRRVLSSIQETAPGDAGETALPSTTFDYVMLSDKDGACVSGFNCTGEEWNRWYYYPRLKMVNNGYGGIISADYETPDSGFWHNKNYRLKSREVTDGITPVNGTHYDYTYSIQRRYLGKNDPYSLTGLDQTSFTYNSEELPPYCSGCVGMTGGNFVGYLTSTVSVKALPANGGQLVNSTNDQFALEYKAVFGRLLTETLRDANLNVVQQVANTWYYTYTVYPPGDPYSAFNSWRSDGVLEAQHYMSATVQLAQQDVTRDGRTVRTSYAYDRHGNPTETIERGFTDVSGDERTTVRAYVYSTTAWLLNRPISETVYSGVPEEPATNPALQTQQNFFYDGSDVLGALPSKGLLTRVDSGAGATWITKRTGYDAWANPIVVTDARGNTLRFSYALSGTYLLSQTNALSQTTSYEYYGIDESDAGAGNGPVGAIKRVIDPNGVAVAYAYDAFSRLTGVVKPGDTFTVPSVSTTYFDVATGTFTLTAPLKIQSQLRTMSGCVSCTQTGLSYYNGIGQLIQSRSASADANQQIVADTIYDALGRVAQTFVPTFIAASTTFTRTSGWNTRPKTETQYDTLGRAVVITNTDGTTVTSAYLGTTTIVTDANGHRKDSVSDAYGRLQIVVEYSGTAAYTTTYSYDALNNLTRVVDALGNTTVITYDALGRKSAMTDPDMGMWSYGYDLDGNLITQTDALSQTLWFKYDGLNRLIEKRLNGSAGTLLASFGYDQGANGIGRRSSAWNPNAATLWGYDARGRVITQTKTVSGTYGFTTTYGYDTADRVVTVTQPSGEVVTATYTAAGQPYSLGGTNAYVVSATYSALGQVASQAFGNNVIANYTYRADNFRLDRIQVGSSILDRQYGYDPVGNITSINDALSGENQSFSYDPLDRITSASGAFSETYSYDATGNMTSKAGLTFNYTDTLHRHAVTALSDGSAYQYDRNGNMTQRVEAGISYTQNWNIDNRLASVTKGNWTTQYFYDADGALVRKVEPRGQTVYSSSDYEVFYPSIVTVTIPSTFTHKLYMPFVSFVPTSGVCRDTCTYYRFNGQQVAVRTGGTVYWLHGDHLGSASASTDVSGAKVSELRYKPYGEIRYSSGNTPTNKRFTSQEEESSIGLYLFGARLYDPQIGRFISADTIVSQPGDPEKLNRYAYSLNNPVKFVDPNGHDASCPGNDAGLCGSSTNSIDSPYWISAYCKGSYGCEQQWLGWYIKNAPDYNPLADPNRYEDDELLPFFQRVIMAYAQAELNSGKEEQAYKFLNARYSGEAADIIIGLGLAGGMAVGPISSGIAAGFRKLAGIRQQIGLSPRTASTGESTAALLYADDTDIWGVSGHGQAVNANVNNISRSHAEADTLNQLANMRRSTGISGGNATMFVDQAPCMACGKFGGIRTMVEAAGLDSLTVYYPGGSVVIYPRK